MAELIQSITTSSQSVVPGEPVAVTVTLNEANPDAIVAIAGIRGNAHTLQAPVAPGDWMIPVLAGTAAGEIDERTVTVTVQETDPVAPFLAVEQDPFKPMSALFSFPGQVFPQGTLFEWLAGPIAATTSEPIWLVDLSAAVDDSRPFTVILIDVLVRYPDESTTRAQRTLTLWSLYQVIRDAGQVSPAVMTNGIASRPLTAQPGVFRGDFTIRNLEPIELQLTSMQLRWLTPSGDDVRMPGTSIPVDIRVPPGARHTEGVELDRATAPEGSDACLVHYSGIAGDLPVYFEVAFDLRTTEPIIFPDEPRYREPWPGEIEEWGRQVLWRVNPAFVEEQEGLTTHGMWVLDRMTQAADQMQDVAVPQRQIARQSRRLNPRVIVDEFRQRFFARDEGVAVRLQPARLQMLSANVPMRTFQHHGIEVGGLLEESFDMLHDRDFHAPIAPGTPCDPDHLPAIIPPNMACQHTGQYEEKLLPHRVMNAEKGDIFLSPGGPGVIGGLLRQVTPAQKYSHTGICTRNRLELCHATASSDWLEAQHSGGVWSPPFGSEPAPSDGFDPNALKFIWPGGVIQNIEQAMVGSEFQGPDGKAYRLSCLGHSGTAQFGNGWEIIPAVIVKPHPLQETPEVRASLHRVADAARELCVTGDDTRQGKHAKLHYRFFHYTDAAIETPAPEGQGWATGTIPVVCSSLHWVAAKRAGVQHFEGPELEPDDLKAGVQLRPGIPDGLYHYTPEERATAANWLYNYYHDKITKTLDDKTGGSALGGIWDTFSDIADDVANQVINTFAHDWTDTEAKDSERWKDEPRAGTAVSPDDLMRWDGPDKGGLWGTFVGMDYRTPRPEKVGVFAWRETTGPGTLVGRVKFHGQPAAGADVRVNGQDLDTDGTGSFTIQLLEGPYIVESGMHVEGIGYVEAKTPVTVLFNQTVEETITLQEPPDLYRRVVINGQGMLRDDETFGSDEVESVGFIRTFDVQPFQSHAEQGWSEGVGDEVLTELLFNVDLQFDRSVTVRVGGSFWESDDEERTDLEMSETWNFTILPGQTQVHRIYLWNKDEDSPGDNLDLMLTLTNDRQP